MGRAAEIATAEKLATGTTMAKVALATQTTREVMAPFGNSLTILVVGKGS